MLLTCAGLWLGSPLLLSTQAVSSLVVHLVWNLDVAWRAISGRHLIGGTEYMWDGRFPLALRLFSLFHLAWPPLLWWALRRVGYDRRALWVQSVFAVIVLAVSRVVMPEENINFAHRDPLWHRSWGSAPVHVGLLALALIGIVYAPIHALLLRAMPPRRARTREVDRPAS